MQPIMQHRRRRASAGLAFFGALVLAACSTAPKAPPADEGATAHAVIASKPSTGTAPVLPRAGSGRGGYYMDDGPGDVTPEGLLDTPDAEPQVEPYSKRGNRPYTVFGKQYTPITDERPFKQRGIGSWYGKKFHGQKTSSGEPYDMYKMTAAHPTLPIPSFVRVTNLKNGTQVILRVNDRGPFHANRIIDLSYTAALKLGYLANGSGELEVERLLPDEIERMARARKEGGQTTVAASTSAVETPIIEAVVQPVALQLPVAAPVSAVAAGAMTATTVAPSAQAAQAEVRPATRGFYLQFGAYGKMANAEAARAGLLRELGDRIARLDAVESGGFYRLMAGPYDSRGAAQDALQRIGNSSAQKPIIVER